MRSVASGDAARERSDAAVSDDEDEAPPVGVRRHGGRGIAGPVTELEEGDEVTWRPNGAATVRVVDEAITLDTKAAERQVRASEQGPQHLVESHSSGGGAAPEPPALHQTQEERS